ncbi:MAG: hypothetical protein M3R15_31670 [Acidobacteriota bacterium]|nr:hypothetical protein [Acidobacteriota bacterium]
MASSVVVDNTVSVVNKVDIQRRFVTPRSPPREPVDGEVRLAGVRFLLLLHNVASCPH